jgi:hypothetical protein
MLIVYEGPGETLITTPEQEALMVQQWITEGARDIQDFDRVAVSSGVVQVTSRLVVHD